MDHLGGWAFAALLALGAAVATVEFYRMVRAMGRVPLVPLGVLAAACAAGLPLVVSNPQAWWVGLLAATVVAAGVWGLRPTGRPRLLSDWQVTVMPVLYVGVLFGFLGLLRQLHQGVWWVTVALVITWAYDTGAYLTGRAVGKRPFMAHISPKKTVEGVGGGLLLAALAACIAVPTLALTIPQALGLGLLSGAMGQVGDLVESGMKREAGVKDAGAIIPGHGGLLDRIDSLLFTGVTVYYAALLLTHA